MLLDLAIGRPAGISSNLDGLDLSVVAGLNADLFTFFAFLGIEEHVPRTRILRHGAESITAFARA
jgi:hypothetical protein